MTDSSLSSPLYYQHSGRFTLVGLLCAALCGLVAGIALAWVYAWFIRWNPFIYISVVATLGVSAAIGAITGEMLEQGRCRNTLVAGLTVLAVLLVGYYVSWAVWLSLVIDKPGAFELLATPSLLLDALLHVNQQGAWSLHSVTATGIVLWLTWALEAAVFLGFGLYLAMQSMTKATFCETCDQMTTPIEGLCFVASGLKPSATDKTTVAAWEVVLDAQAVDLKQQLENKQFSALQQLGAVQNDEPALYRADCSSCATCKAFHTLHVRQFRAKFEGGKVADTSNQRDVVKGLLLTSAQLQALRTVSTKLVPLPADLAALHAKALAAE